MLSAKAQKSLETVVSRFQSGDISPVVEILMIRKDPADDKPFDHWSLGNKIIAYMQTGATDCRGFKQWQKVGRAVSKGSSAAFILGPCTRKRKDAKTGEDVVFVSGFTSIPVFPMDCTTGDTLPSYDYEPRTLPPLMDAAERLGVSVEYMPSFGGERGSFDPTTKAVRLHTENTKTWFHELAHAAHGEIETLKNGQNAEQETVAEFTASILMELYGYENQSGNSWEYIAHYNSDPLTAIVKALSTVEKALDIILRDGDGNEE